MMENTFLNGFLSFLGLYFFWMVVWALFNIHIRGGKYACKWSFSSHNWVKKRTLFVDEFGRKFIISESHCSICDRLGDRTVERF